MPDELLLTTPPILQVAWLAGSGPSLRLNGFSARLAVERSFYFESMLLYELRL